MKVIEIYNLLSAKFETDLIFGCEYEFYVQSAGLIIESIEAPEYPESLAKKLAEGLNFGTIACERGKGQYEYISTPMQIEQLAGAYHADVAIIRANAHRLNYQIIDDPKPYADDYGSALQVSISFSRHNADKFEKLIYALLRLSSQAQYYLNTDSGFGRFVSNMMAPTHIAWGVNNRTCLIRVPNRNVERPRLEYRLANNQTCITKILQVILIAWHISNTCDLEPVEPIWGNAHDAQYQLKEIPNTPESANKTIQGELELRQYLAEWFDEQI